MPMTGILLFPAGYQPSLSTYSMSYPFSGKSSVSRVLSILSIQFELVPPRLTTHTFFSFSWFVRLWVGSQDTQETHDSCLLPANSFGDDEEPSTSSESDEDVTKQFEISVSRSQSFRTGAPEKGKTTELEPKTKCNHLLSVHREDSAEVSACEGIQFSLFLLHLGKGWPVLRMLVDNLNTCACRVQKGKKKKRNHGMGKSPQRIV